MSAAIFYDGYESELGRPVGIDVATEEFIKAFIRHANQDTLYAVTPNERAFFRFRNAAAAEGVAPRRCTAVGQYDADTLAEAGTLFRYSPDVLDHLWDRRAVGQRRYSICGITHTSSTARVMDILGGLVTAPSQPWDALICASTAIRSAALSLFETWGDYLGSRFGTPPIRPPLQMPVIPLGVDAAHFTKITSENERQRQRALLKLGDDEILVLFVGRLSHITKANPFPLLLAAEQVALESGNSLHLMFYGYFADDVTETAFREAATEICSAAQVHFVIEGNVDYPQGPWAGADIFCSPVDNIQESFGLTPVEAMAAALPVIVSDWDGYRDTVRNDVDGFTLPTIMPSAGTGVDLAERHRRGIDVYGDYVGAVAQATAVDIGALVRALRQLASNNLLRQRMGEAGRERVLSLFDWRQVIRAYEELWEELRTRREHDKEIAALATSIAPHPLRPDPFSMFVEFAERPFARDDTIELAITDWAEMLKRIRLRISIFNAPTLIELEDLPLLIGHLEAEGGSTVNDIVIALNGLDSARLIRSLIWLIKLGICRNRAA